MRLKRLTIGLLVVSVMAICLSLVSGAPAQNQNQRTNEDVETQTSGSKEIIKRTDK